MPNKHQIQKDFYTKMSEWKESFKVSTKTQQREKQAINVSEAAQYGIKGVTGMTKEELTYKETPEYKALVKEADKRIEENRKIKAEAMKGAKDCIAR